LNGDGFFRWVGWGRLFHMSWLRTAFSKLYTLSHQLFLLTYLRSEVVNRLVTQYWTCVSRVWWWKHEFLKNFHFFELLISHSRERWIRLSDFRVRICCLN
jgi:hypothetical protein